MKEKNITLINLVGSPGSGKTSLLECLIQNSNYRIGVIEGDLFTDLDHQRIVQLGIPSYQLNTQGACHLEPILIEEALKHFDLDQLDYLFIDNIGNLVCTASFYLGEDIRIHDIHPDIPCICTSCTHDDHSQEIWKHLKNAHA